MKENDKENLKGTARHLWLTALSVIGFIKTRQIILDGTHAQNLLLLAMYLFVESNILLLVQHMVRIQVECKVIENWANGQIGIYIFIYFCVLDSSVKIEI